MALLLIRKTKMVLNNNKHRVYYCLYLCTFCNKEVERRRGTEKTCLSCGCQKGKLISEKNKGVSYITEIGRERIKEANRNRLWGEESKEKIVNSLKGNSYAKGFKHSEINKLLWSEQRKGKNNPNYGKVTYGTGRVKWFDYSSPIAGDVRLQGTYELRFAKILDKLGWEWQNTKEYFPYCEDHSYVPDFKVLLNDKIIYFDTKGWFSEKEQNKIKQVRENCDINLIIVTKDILQTYERMMQNAI